jgi:large subunit ribosomal protein L22
MAGSSALRGAGAVEVRAIARHIRISPQKVRLVLDAIRGKPVAEALAMLRYMPQKATVPVSKALQSASANAENNFNLDPQELVIVRVSADEGRTLKRYRPRARGRANQILKRSSHVTVVVSEREA